MTSYHFSCGNSSEGSIGFCARVEADSEPEALDKLQNFLQACVEVNLKKNASVEGDEDIEYCNVYISPENVSVDDIDEEDG